MSGRAAYLRFAVATSIAMMFGGAGPLQPPKAELPLEEQQRRIRDAEARRAKKAAKRVKPC